MLAARYTSDPNIIEVGIDEAGRGPMLGRVYAAAVVLPPADQFDHSRMKDSKKFHSEKKIKEVAEYIKADALAWHVAYSTEQTIDLINIRRATHQAMHDAAAAVRNQLITKGIVHATTPKHWQLLVDGNDFTPMTVMVDSQLQALPFVCIEGGDNKFSAIAAASILAKVARDQYISELCLAHPELNTRYDLLSNKGYGAKKHMDGIRQYGLSPFHRKTFGICKTFSANDLKLTAQ